MIPRRDPPAWASCAEAFSLVRTPAAARRRGRRGRRRRRPRGARRSWSRPGTRAAGSRQASYSACQGAELPAELLAHVSPLGWEHINLTGEYRWPGTDRRATRNASRRISPPPANDPSTSTPAASPTTSSPHARSSATRSSRASGTCPRSASTCSSARASRSACARWSAAR